MFKYESPKYVSGVDIILLVSGLPPFSLNPSQRLPIENQKQTLAKGINIEHISHLFLVFLLLILTCI